MKKHLLLTAVIFSVLSCKKDKPVVNQTVFGKWELRARTGGFSGATTHYSPGNGDIYQFSNDSTYTWTENNRLEASGNFHIIITAKAKNMQYGTIKLGDMDGIETFTFKGDTINIGLMSSEAMISTYVKIK